MTQVDGVSVALVVDNRDPENLGRVKVWLPWTDGEARVEAWARVATLMAGNNRGAWFIPDVNDEVLVAFERGDVRRPYVIGGLWNSSGRPPATMDANNTKKLLRTRGGLQIALEDRSGQESIVVETPGGQKITLGDGPGAV